MNTRTVLITGGAKRIGKDLVEFLAQQNYIIALHYNTSEHDAIEIREKYKNVHIFKCDLSDIGQVEQMFDDIKKKLGSIDVLINNASYFSNDDIHTLNEKSFDLHMNINLKAPLFLCMKFFESFKHNNTNGIIINIIDQRIHKPHVDYMSYTLSKSTLWTLTQNLALAMAPHIRVNGIAPGPVLSNIYQTKQDFIDEYCSIPLKSNVSTMDLCNAVKFLIDTPSITGHLLFVDGGQHLS